MDKIIELLQWVLWVIQSGVHDGNACPSMSCDASERVIGAVRGRAPAYRCVAEGDHDTHRSYDDSHTWPNIKIGERGRAIARATFLLPALADDALHAVLLVCEAAPKRALDAGTLAEEQRAREGTAPAELTDAQVLEACARGGAITEEQRARLEADGRPLAVSRAMANALGSVIDHHEDTQALPMPDVMLNLDPVEGGELTKRAMVVHEAAERLGLVSMNVGSDAWKAREDLFAALGAYFGSAIKALEPPTIQRRAEADREALVQAGDVMPGEPADKPQARRAIDQAIEDAPRWCGCGLVTGPLHQLGSPGCNRSNEVRS